MKQQTVVQWLAEQLLHSDDITVFQHIIKQAEEMQKKQHEKTWFDSTLQFDNSAEMTNKKLFDDYYNENYKNNINE